MRNAWRGIAIGLAALVVLAAGAGPATAGEDPYGSTSTTAPTSFTATCGLSVTEGRPGASVAATVRFVPLGQTVRVLFDGKVVGRATAPDVVANAAVGAVTFNGEARPAGTTTTTVTVDFVVPDVPPGSYLVTAVGDTFTSVCGPDVAGAFEVLAAVVDDGVGGGALPRTGIYVGLFLMVAAALLLLGRAMMAESKRRRRQASREAGAHHRVGV